MHGTCLSGLYPVPFTHNAHDYPHFNIYISFMVPNIKNHHQNHLNIKIFYSSTMIHKHFDLKYEHYHGIINLEVP
ncbi:ALH_1b_G0027960.mRNA.1.CDS.1 [Saccharomyces cerevisiae]|nr:ALH_1b_G0027960.mRNA.1.CDS.1 [Saccharomyces cerevisiae]CAI6724810.1 ALH_1b_G0027960.mRNA.1.CDS.1 [Saccharomyces cerevisiae]